MLKTALRKTEKSMFMPTVFITLNLITYLALGLILFPIFENIKLVYLSVGIEVLMLIFWAAASIKDPGFIRKPKETVF